MARVSLFTDDERPDVAAIVARIKGKRPSINVYRLLLHSPAVALAWFEFNDTIRTQITLDDKAVELAIIRVLQINKVPYLLSMHLSKLAAAAGLSAEQIEALPRWRQAKVFDERERAVLNLAESMTKTIRVAQTVFDALRRHFDERQIVELTVIIGCYNMHSRVLEALEMAPGKARGPSETPRRGTRSSSGAAA